MTKDNIAVRRPVRWGARWLARLEASAPIIQMVSLVVTGLSTSLLVLRQYGYANYAREFIVVGAVSAILFIWIYTEKGIYNQQKRDRADFGSNFAAPSNLIDDTMISRGVAAGQKGRPLDAVERDSIHEEMEQAYIDHRDGVDIERILEERT